MNLKVLKKNKNPFLNREELQVEIKAESTPSFEQVKTALEKDPELTIIKRIDSNFGAKTFHADVLVYDNKEAKDRVEPKSKNKEEAPAQPPTAPATPTQPKQETPPQETKEEIKQEIKQEEKKK